jgi:predicted DNA-binding transcriptional regulator AlpA
VNDEFLKQNYLTMDEVATILKLRNGAKTLRSRISRGTEHPPYVEIGNAFYFPKSEFLAWAEKRPIVWEVKSAS